MDLRDVLIQLGTTIQVRKLATRLHCSTAFWREKLILFCKIRQKVENCCWWQLLLTRPQSYLLPFTHCTVLILTHNIFTIFLSIFLFNLINIQTFTKQISSKRNVEKFSAKDTKTVFCEILSLKLSTVQSKCTQTSIKVYVDTCLKLSRLTYIRLHLRKFAVLSKELFDYSLFNVIRFY